MWTCVVVYKQDESAWGMGCVSHFDTCTTPNILTNNACAWSWHVTPCHTSMCVPNSQLHYTQTSLTFPSQPASHSPLSPCLSFPPSRVSLPPVSAAGSGGWLMLFCPLSTVPSSSSAPRVITSSVQIAGSTVEPWGMRDTRLQHRPTDRRTDTGTGASSSRAMHEQNQTAPVTKAHMMFNLIAASASVLFLP